MSVCSELVLEGNNIKMQLTPPFVVSTLTDSHKRVCTAVITSHYFYLIVPSKPDTLPFDQDNGTTENQYDF